MGLTDHISAGSARIRQVRALIRITPFDTSTPEGRSLERLRRIFWTTLASAGARVVASVTRLVTIPLALGYLNPERFGVWTTINNFIFMLSFADLGLGNGLMTKIAEADGKNDRELMRRYVSSAFVVLCGVAVVAAGLFAVIYPWVPWAKFFNVTSELARSESGPAVAACAIVFAINIPLGIVVRVQLGLQEGFANSLWTAAGNISGLIAVVIAIRFHAGLPVLVLALAGAPTFEAMLNAGYLFFFRHRWLRPRWSLWSWETAYPMLRVGVMFMIVQACVYVGFYSDIQVAIRLPDGPIAVTQYSVHWTLFSVIGTVLMMAMSPLWPAYGEAVSRGDAAWAKRMLARSLILTGLFSSLIAAALAVAGPFLLHLWVKDNVSPSGILLWGLACCTVLQSLGATLAMFQNGVGAIREQAVIAVLFALVSLALKIVFSRWIGVAGIAWGTVIAYTVISVPGNIVVTRRILASLKPHAPQEVVPEQVVPGESPGV